MFGNNCWVEVTNLSALECGYHVVRSKLFIKAQNIVDEPIFKWWIPYTLKKSDRIVSFINIRIKVVTHKYGIEIPTRIEHTKRFIEKNDNRLWNRGEDLFRSDIWKQFKLEDLKLMSLLDYSAFPNIYKQM